MNIRIANSYRTVSNEALCIIAGLISIGIKIEETAKLLQISKRIKRVDYISNYDRTTNWSQNIDYDVQPKD